MSLRSVAVDLVVGMAAGAIATRVTDRVQRGLYRLTPQSEKAREPRVPRGSSAMVAARKLAARLDAHPDHRQLALLKSAIHYGLGLGWGGLYGLLRRYSRMNPVGAGTVTGATLSLVIDEALCPALGIAAPSHRYPVSSHLRGFVTHIVYGLALAAAAETIFRAIGHSPSEHGAHSVRRAGT